MDITKQALEFFAEASAQSNEDSFSFIGLTDDEMNAILKSKSGITEALQREFPHLCYRSGGRPLKFMMVLYAWELYGRKATISAIASSLGLSTLSVPQYMSKVRKAVNAALGLDIVLNGNTYELSSIDNLQERVENLRKAMLKLVPKFEKFSKAYVSAQKQGYSGHPLLGSAEDVLSGVEMARKALSAAS